MSKNEKTKIVAMAEGPAEKTLQKLEQEVQLWKYPHTQLFYFIVCELQKLAIIVDQRNVHQFCVVYLVRYSLTLLLLFVSDYVSNLP